MGSKVKVKHKNCIFLPSIRKEQKPGQGQIQMSRSFSYFFTCGYLLQSIALCLVTDATWNPEPPTRQPAMIYLFKTLAIPILGVKASVMSLSLEQPASLVGTL